MTNTRFRFNVETAWDSLAGLSVTRAVNYLTYVFDCHDDEVKMENKITTPQLISYNNTANVPARCIPIHFWGGPPGEEEWYEGNLVTMLIDRLFFNIAVGNTDRVLRFQESFAKTHA